MLFLHCLPGIENSEVMKFHLTGNIGQINTCQRFNSILRRKTLMIKTDS